MSTVATVDPLSTARSLSIALELVEPHPDNPRRIDDKHPSLDGLAQSIRETGLINPITVQQLEGGNRFRILAGERRWRAAKKAGLPQIIARVVTVTDEQAFHILTVENLQREDLHWLEEARGVEAMVKHGWDAATIAKHVGRSEQWVRLRAKLAAISPAWKKAVEDPEHDLHGWPAAMLELIARFPITTQDEILKRDAWDLLECKSVADLRVLLDKDWLLALKAAPWQLDDAQLVPKAGACSTCPKRSSCQQQLFAETKDDRCLDAACWKAKGDAHVLSAIAAAKKAQPKAILIGSTYQAPASLQKQVQPSHGFKTAKKTDKGAVPAIIVTGDKVGETTWVVKADGYSRNDVTRSRERAGGDKPKAVPAKERLAQFMKRRARQAIGIVIEKLGGKRDATSVNHWGQLKGCAAGVVRPPRSALIALAVTFGIKGLTEYEAAAWKTFERHDAMDQPQLDAALWELVRRSVISRLIGDKEFRADGAGAEVIAKFSGLDWKAIVAGVRDAMPLPKTLAAEFDQDGRPLKGLTAKPAAKAARAKA